MCASQLGGQNQAPAAPRSATDTDELRDCRPVEARIAPAPGRERRHRRRTTRRFAATIQRCCSWDQSRRCHWQRCIVTGGRFALSVDDESATRTLKELEETEARIGRG